MFLRSLKPFYKKINDLYLRFFTSVYSNSSIFYCQLCGNKFNCGWDNHKKELKHCEAVNCIAEQLIYVVFCPGIVFRPKTKDGFCIFCNTALTEFLSDLQSHLITSNHEKQVEAYKMICEAFQFSDIHIADDNENGLLKKLIGIGIRVAGERQLECFSCDNYKMTDRNQLSAHIRSSIHLKRTINQLCIAANMMYFDRGVTIRNEGFWCLICENIIGSGLAGALKLFIHISTCETERKKCLLNRPSCFEDENLSFGGEGSSPSEDNKCMELSDGGSSSSEDYKCMEISDNGSLSPDNGSSSSDKKSEDYKCMEIFNENPLSNE